MNNGLRFAPLALIGLFALSPAVAEAGGAAGAAPLNTFFECYPITGGHVGTQVSTHEVSLGDGDVVTPNVRVGNAVLFCRQVAVNLAGQELIPDGTEIKCYNVTTSGPQDKPDELTLTDAFGAETVRVPKAPRVLCGPAQATFAP